MIAETTFYWLVCGGLVLIMGFLLRYLKWSFLLDGFHPGSYVPEDLAVEVIGAHVLTLGGVVFGMGVLKVFLDVPVFVEIGAGVAALLVALRGFYEVHRYRSDGFL